MWFFHGQQRIVKLSNAGISRLARRLYIVKDPADQEGDMVRERSVGILIEDVGDVAIIYSWPVSTTSPTSWRSVM
jgi:hypothetical protein